MHCVQENCVNFKKTVDRWYKKKKFLPGDSFINHELHEQSLMKIKLNKFNWGYL